MSMLWSQLISAAPSVPTVNRVMAGLRHNKS